MGGACGELRHRPRQGADRRQPGPQRAPVRRGRAQGEGMAPPVHRHRRRLRRQGQAGGRVPLQRLFHLVHRRQDRHAAQAGLEGQPHRDRLPPRGRGGGHRDAGKRPARLAPVRRAAHAHVRLPRQDPVDGLHPQGQVAGQQRGGRDGAVALPRWRADGQGTAGAGRRRWRDLQPGRRPSRGRGDRRRLCRRAGGDGGNQLLARGRCRPPDHGPITALAWSPAGTHLAVGTETGFAGIVDLSTHPGR